MNKIAIIERKLGIAITRLRMSQFCKNGTPAYNFKNNILLTLDFLELTPQSCWGRMGLTRIISINHALNTAAFKRMKDS
jgi:hypothetical protein